LRYIYLFGGTATVVSGPLIGKLSDRYGKKQMFTILAIISVIPILMITHLAEGHSKLFIFSLTTLFFIFFGGRFIPAMALVTSSIVAKDRGKFMSINSSVQQLSNAFATSIAGFVISNGLHGELIGYNWVGYISATATAITIFLAYRIKIVS
jgi:predicted MFS family arabinose efflux permease